MGLRRTTSSVPPTPKNPDKLQDSLHGQIANQANIPSIERSLSNSRGMDNTHLHSNDIPAAGTKTENVRPIVSEVSDNSTEANSSWIKVPKSRLARTSSPPSVSSAPKKQKTQSTKEKSKWTSPLYTTKLEKKSMETSDYRTDEPSDSNLAPYYAYCKRDFSITKSLRKPTKIKIEILHLLKDRKLNLFKLPPFLNQIFPLKKIGFFEAFLTKRHCQELFVQLAPGTKQTKALPDYAIRLNIHTSGTVPSNITEAISKFQNDVEDLYFIPKKRYIVFSFKSKVLAQQWVGKYIPYQNKPLQLRQYFNNERHQAIPMSDLGEQVKLQGKSRKEKRDILEQVKTIIPYSFLLTNVSPLIKLRHLIILFSDILHLDVGRINSVINPYTGKRQTSTWEVTLLSEGIPEILNRITCIKWSEYSVHLFHNTIHTTYPCTKCCAATHSYASCPNKMNGKQFDAQIIVLTEDKDLVDSYIESLPESSLEQDWDFLMSFQPTHDQHYAEHVSHELQLYRYGLEKDIMLRANKRRSEANMKQQKQQKKKANSKHARSLILKQKQRPNNQTLQQRLSAERSLNKVFNLIDSFIDSPKDRYGLFLIPDRLFMQSTPFFSKIAKSPPRLSKRQLDDLVTPNVLVNVITASELPLPLDSLTELQTDAKVKSVIQTRLPSVTYPKARDPPQLMFSSSEHKQESIKSHNRQVELANSSSLPMKFDQADKKLVGLEKWLIRDAHVDSVDKRTLQCSLVPNPDAERQLMSTNDSWKIRESTLVSSTNTQCSVSKQEPLMVNNENSSIKQPRDLVMTDVALPSQKSNQSVMKGATTALVRSSTTSSKSVVTHLTMSQQTELMKTMGYFQTSVPGNGHCFWIAVLLGHCNISLTNFPHLSDLEEANLCELKRSIRDYFYIEVDDLLLQELSSPSLDSLINQHAPNKITPIMRRKCLADFFDRITSTCSNEPLSSEYWGCSSLFSLVSMVLKKIVYVVDFNHPWASRVLQKYDYTDGPNGSCTTVEFSVWSKELTHAKDHKIVIGFMNSNHFCAYLHAQDKGTSSSAKDRNPPISSSKVRVSAADIDFITESDSEIEGMDINTSIDTMDKPKTTISSSKSPIDSEMISSTESDLSGFSELTPETKSLAIDQYRALNTADLHAYANSNDMAPDVAACELLDVCKASAKKIVSELRSFPEDDITPQAVPSSPEYIPNATGGSLVIANPKTNLIEASPASKVLMAKQVNNLLPDEIVQQKKCRLADLQHECWTLHKQVIKRYKSSSPVPVIAQKMPSWLYYNKWASNQPELLLALIQQVSAPVLFMSQLSLTSITMIGKFHCASHIRAYLMCVTKAHSKEKAVQIIHGWLATAKIIKQPVGLYNVMTAPLQWRKLIKGIPTTKPTWAIIRDQQDMLYAIMLYNIIPSLFQCILEGKTFPENHATPMTMELTQIWDVYANSPVLTSCVQSIKKHDWSGLRQLLKSLQFSKCLVLNKTLRY